MINFSQIPASGAFKAWINFVQTPSSDGRKWYVCRDPVKPHCYFKSTDFKVKMTSLEIIDKIEGLLQEGNLRDSLEIGHELLDKLKKSLESHYYRGVIGRIRKVASWIFKRYSFENSLHCKKIIKIRNKLDLKKESYNLSVPQLEKSFINSRASETKKKLEDFSEERGIKYDDTHLLHTLKTCWEEFFSIKRQDIQILHNQKGLVSSDEWRSLVKAWNEKTESLDKLNLNPFLKMVWYWKEIEDLYTHENLDVLKQLALLFPESFQKRNEELKSFILRL